MYRKPQLPRRRSFAAIALATHTLLGHAEGATLLRFEFEDPLGNFLNAPVTLASGLATSAWADTDGTLTSFTGNPGRALGGRSFDDGNAFSLAIQIDPGLTLTLTGAGFDQQASASGPSAWTLAINGLAVANGATGSTFQTEHADFALPDLSGSVLLVLSATGASSGAGTFRLDNFELSGAVAPVPLPASLTLLMPACAWLIPWRRQHA